jgi:hypothetical protein
MDAALLASTDLEGWARRPGINNRNRDLDGGFTINPALREPLRTAAEAIAGTRDRPLVHRPAGGPVKVGDGFDHPRARACW